jgi:acyl-CoA reductase-like NAD-dependent aldehyde dehydrogenase
LDARSRAALLRECISGVLAVAQDWSTCGLKVKGLSHDSAEELLAGPLLTVRHLRLLAASMDSIAASGSPRFGTWMRQRDDGRLEVGAFPDVALDRFLYRGFGAYVLMQEGVDRTAALEAQAPFYQLREPEGGVALILGAGNVSSIPASDVLTKMFNGGMVCLLKMNPVNEWVGPYLERALDPLIRLGFLRVVYGGREVGQYLANHDGIDSVHLTGSSNTYEELVWGAAGPVSDRRRLLGEPLLTKPITSELGNITPVAVVPHSYSDEELAFQARNVATMVANNASFNCNSAKVIITGSGWPQRDRFIDLITTSLARMPNRDAYYPGAIERYNFMTRGRSGLHSIGQPKKGQLPWTVIRGVDAGVRDDPLFRMEPFCPIIAETSLASTDPATFLVDATQFMNDTLWGTLSASIVIHPTLEKDPEVSSALDRAVTELRYGNLAINHWTALNYSVGTLPWGGHPSSSLEDIQSGLGWAHNTFMLGRVDKAVLRGSLRVQPAPVWFADNPKTGRAGPKLIDMEARPRWRKVPGLFRALL